MSFDIQVTIPCGRNKITHLRIFTGFYWKDALAVGIHDSSDSRENICLFEIKNFNPHEKRDHLDLEHQHSENFSMLPTDVFFEFYSYQNNVFLFCFQTKVALSTLLLSTASKQEYIAQNNNFRMQNPAFLSEVNAKKLPTKLPFSLRVTQVTGNVAKYRTEQSIFGTSIKQETLEKAVAICDALMPILQPFQHHRTPFQNLRTFKRIDNFSCLFTNLPAVNTIQANSSSPVAYELPLYFMNAALFLNKISHETMREKICYLQNIDEMTLLRIVRDALMAFTLCKFEGVYLADTFYGIEGDDQPCVEARHFYKDRYFSKDDCEGRLYQGYVISYSAFKMFSRLETNFLLNTMRTNPRNRMFAMLDDRTLECLIQCTQTVGWLLDSKIIAFYPCTGESMFKQVDIMTNKYTGLCVCVCVSVP